MWQTFGVRIATPPRPPSKLEGFTLSIIKKQQKMVSLKQRNIIENRSKSTPDVDPELDPDASGEYAHQSYVSRPSVSDTLLNLQT